MPVLVGYILLYEYCRQKVTPDQKKTYIYLSQFFRYMTDLDKHYQWLYENSVQQIREGLHHTDSFLNTREDYRRGLTLIIRPPRSVTDRVKIFLDELQMAEPEQYYQPQSDMHITVLSVFNCFEGFSLDRIQVEDYIATVASCIKCSSKFEIDLKGVTTAMDGVMIKGYFEDNSLNQLRDCIRERFRTSGLDNDIDSRYRIDAAHMTVVRFRKPLKNRNTFLEIIERFRNTDFGGFSVENIDFVFNNWYVTEKSVRLLKRFPLP